MLFRRRANLSSASPFHRRASHEIAAKSANAHHHLPTTIHPSLSHLTVPYFRTMLNGAPPTSPPISPASSTKWERARPVSARYSCTKPLHGMPTSRPLLPTAQFIRPIEAWATNQQEHPHRTSNTPRIEALDISIDKALRKTQLGYRPPTLRFQPSPRMAAQHTTAAFTSAASMPEPVAHVKRHCQSDARPSSEQTGEKPKSDHGRSRTQEGEVFQAHANDEEISLDSNNVDSSSGSEYWPNQEVEGSVMEEAKSQEEEGKEENGTEAEEHIDLTFQIPEDTMRAAMLASENTRASFWSTKMYRGPNGQSIATHYCRSKEIAERVAQYFLKEKVVGFDIEWKPFSSPYDLKKNASLIQLACEDRIALFHISQFPGTTAEQLMPPSLKAVLETPDIYKVGVAVKGDFSRLQKYLNIQPQGVFELSRLHNLVELHSTSPTKLSNKLVSLANQVLQHLQLPLYKGAPLAGEPMDTESVRESDWSKPLDKQQIHYAAADAYAGFRLYHILEWKRKQLRPTPPTRGICDYDSKRDPKPKASKMKAAKTKKASKDTIEQSTVAVEPDDEADQHAEQDAVAEAEEIDEEEDEFGYSTAPEEPTDSINPEDPPRRSAVDIEPSTASNGGMVGVDIRTHKRVGRVNLAWLRGPDPEYPILPQAPDDENAPQTSHLEDDSATHPDNVQNVISSSEIHFPLSETVDDEFADPELEKVLQILDLDLDGVREDNDPVVVADKMLRAAGAGSAPKSSTLSATSRTDTETFDNLPSHLEADQTIADSSPNNENVALATDDTLHTPEYNDATTWAQNYLHSTIPSPSSTTPSRIRATVPHLRAYHMWHVQELSLDTISGHLRDPPLAHSTVTGYILQAVSLERLDYDKDAMRDIMAELPKGLKLGRWKWMADKLGALK